MNDDADALAEFSGVARLFPLPNLVLFPHAVQPLHVFEPRYRQMIADALAGDGLVAMALLQPGWEDEYAAAPQLYPVVCLGRITAHRRFPDGRYVVLLRGLVRARIVEELPSDRLYRQARLELLSDVSVLTLPESRQLRRRLRDLVLPRAGGTAADRAQLREVFDGETPLAALCDALCHQLPLPLPRKMELLEETDVCVRARALVAALEAVTAPPAKHAGRPWPPEFSVN